MKKKTVTKKSGSNPKKVCIFPHFGSETNFGSRFFFFHPSDSRGKKKNRKIGLHRGREESVCDNREIKKPPPFGRMLVPSLLGV